jgi:hypothetical protein
VSQSTVDTIACINCTSPVICSPGKTYMPPGQCSGMGTKDSSCLVCSTVSCPFGTYQSSCQGYQDTTCTHYTACTPGVTTLRNRGLFNDGESRRAPSLSVGS